MQAHYVVVLGREQSTLFSQTGGRLTQTSDEESLRPESSREMDPSSLCFVSYLNPGCSGWTSQTFSGLGTQPLHRDYLLFVLWGTAVSAQAVLWAARLLCLPFAFGFELHLLLESLGWGSISQRLIAGRWPPACHTGATGHLQAKGDGGAERVAHPKEVP